MKRLALAPLFVAALPLAAQTLHPEMVVTTEWLADHLGKVAILEVGDSATYTVAHIPGARLIETSQLLVQRNGTPNELPTIDALETLFTRAGVGNRERIILYSRDPILAARAWFTLDYLGHGQRAAILDGGFAKWTDEQRPVSVETVPATPARFESRVKAAAVAQFKSMRELVRYREILGDDLVIIDARSPEQYRGTEAGADVTRAGHIPGAANIPWSENLTTSVVPRFLPEPELRDLYTSAGVTPKSTNIIYCRTGMQASVGYFVLRYLGYDAILYDGSFIEWSRDRSTAIGDAATP
ncbi:MAG TPA: sulfurtransferase [Thermoanaerobaculia bacterium]